MTRSQAVPETSRNVTLRRIIAWGGPALAAQYNLPHLAGVRLLGNLRVGTPSGARRAPSPGNTLELVPSRSY